MTEREWHLFGGEIVDDLGSKIAVYTDPKLAATVVADHNAQAQLHKAANDLGRWLSPALDDPDVCDAMKADVQAWFDAGQPIPSARLGQGGGQEPQPVAWQYRYKHKDDNWSQWITEPDKFDDLQSHEWRPLYAAPVAARPDQPAVEFQTTEEQLRAWQKIGHEPRFDPESLAQLKAQQNHATVATWYFDAVVSDLIAARAALSRAPAGPQWRLIATAPRADTRYIIGARWDGKQFRDIGKYAFETRFGDNEWLEDEHGNAVVLTHWIDLPSFPATPRDEDTHP